MADLGMLTGSTETSTSRSRFGSDGSGLNYSDTDPLDDGTSDEEDDDRLDYMANSETSYSGGWSSGDPTSEEDDRTDYTADGPTDAVVSYSGTTAGLEGAAEGGSIVDAPETLGQSVDSVLDLPASLYEDVESSLPDPDDYTPDWLTWILNHQEEVLIGVVVLAFAYATEGTVGTPGGS